jgi:hypothetical protein
LHGGDPPAIDEHDDAVWYLALAVEAAARPYCQHLDLPLTYP